MSTSPLTLDLYELTMAAGYIAAGRAEHPVTCEAVFRRQSPHRRFYLAAGLERVLAYLEELHFSDEDLDFLATVPGLREAFTPAVRERLGRLRFTGDVWAIPEGEVVFAGEPLLRVSAPLVEAQLVETFLLSALNHSLTVAAKAARVVIAAAGKSLAEFGSRRTDPEAAQWAARAAWLAGFHSTSNVAAGRRFGIPLSGTMAHQWVMSFSTEEEAFRGWRGVFPSATLLIDTYDTERGAARAAASGPSLGGVRLDSGDYDALSRRVRATLDEAGQKDAHIVVSGDLDEHVIARLVAAGAPIDAYGVGTQVVVSPDAPTVGAVFKLVDDPASGGAKVKLCGSKSSWPGKKQVYRSHDPAHDPEWSDTVAVAGEADAVGRPLLVEVMHAGRRTGAGRETLAASRERALHQIARLPPTLTALAPSDAPPPVRWSPGLERLTEEARARARRS